LIRRREISRFTIGLNCPARPFVLFWRTMSTALEIEAAIRKLSPLERQKLVADLPTILPELDGDMAWNRIIGNTETRPGLTALLDSVEADYKKNPAAFSEITDKDFDLNS
jgi:hypothetical protein